MLEANHRQFAVQPFNRCFRDGCRTRSCRKQLTNAIRSRSLNLGGEARIEKLGNPPYVLRGHRRSATIISQFLKAPNPPRISAWVFAQPQELPLHPYMFAEHRRDDLLLDTRINDSGFG